MIKDLKKEYKKEKQGFIEDYTKQIEALQTNLTDKTNEVKLMQSELKLVKEFRRKRALMQKEIDDVRVCNFVLLNLLTVSQLSFVL